jgi:hypothetical protein
MAPLLLMLAALGAAQEVPTEDPSVEPEVPVEESASEEGQGEAPEDDPAGASGLPEVPDFPPSSDTSSGWLGEGAAEEPAAGDTGTPWRERLTLTGEVGAGSAYRARNSSSPLDPLGTVLPDSHAVARFITHLTAKYQVLESHPLVIGGEAFLVGSWDGGKSDHRSDLDVFPLELYLEYSTDNYRFVAGRRNALHSVGYFRYPMDFYETDPAGFLIGSEGPQAQIGTRYGPILASVQRQWSWGATTIEYIPRFGEVSSFDWHSNAHHQLIGRLSFLVSGLSVNVAASQSFDRSTQLEGGQFELRQSDVTQVGTSGTYVVGDALELHAEVAYRRDQRFPEAVSETFSFTEPFAADVPLPVWRGGQERHLVRLLVGGQYTFDDRTFLDGWNVILEYYFQNEGLSGSQWDEYFAQLERLRELAELAAGGGGPFQSQIQPIAVTFGTTNLGLLNRSPAFWGRHYGFLRFAKNDLLVDGLEFSVFAVSSLQDRSLTAGTGVSFNFWDSFQLKTNVQVFTGGQQTEFGRLPYRLLGQLELYYLL